MSLDNKRMSKEHNGQRKDTWDFNNFVRGIFVFKVWSEIGTRITVYLKLTSRGTLRSEKKTHFHPDGMWSTYSMGCPRFFHFS